MDSNVNDSLRVAEHGAGAGKTAPRVSLNDILDKIVYEAFFTAGDAVHALGSAGSERSDLGFGVPYEASQALGLLTIGVFVLDNGFTVLGKSAPASPENFDVELGRKLAKEDAVRQLWPLMGFALRERLYGHPLDAIYRAEDEALGAELDDESRDDAQKRQTNLND